MKICVTGGKGGTGKSTVATSLALEFARAGKTFLIDVDVDCPNDYLILAARRRKDMDVYHPVPKWDFSKCTKCGICAGACKQDAIIFSKGRFPAFLPELCIGCGACMLVCPAKAMTPSRKRIGTIYRSRVRGLELFTGELKIGELASGEMVAETRKKAEKAAGDGTVVIDSAAGIGCPVIASITGSDYVVAVTEPTPSALQDMKRVLHIAAHFGIRHGIVINKSTLDRGFRGKIKAFAKKSGIPVIEEIPYDEKFVHANVKMEPLCLKDEKVRTLFSRMAGKIRVMVNE
jgi:MinD superfamily P-loop ATPase